MGTKGSICSIIPYHIKLESESFLSMVNYREMESIEQKIGQEIEEVLTQKCGAVKIKIADLKNDRGQVSIFDITRE